MVLHFGRTSKMSHDHGWRAACGMTIWILRFRFEIHEEARGVTAKVVGSGALLGSGARMKTHRRKAGDKLGKTRDLIFREAVAIARMVAHALTRRLLRVLRRRQKATVVHARTVSQLHSDFPSLALSCDSATTSVPEFQPTADSRPIFNFLKI
jgi:hypothetical protein